MRRHVIIILLALAFFCAGCAGYQPREPADNRMMLDRIYCDGWMLEPGEKGSTNDNRCLAVP